MMHLLVPFLALLLSPSLLLASGGGEAAGDPTVALWGMAIKILNFVIVLAVLAKFLAKPLASYLNTRAALAREQLAGLRSRLAAEEEALRQSSLKINSLDAEIDRLRTAAHLEMEQERQAVLAEAHRASEQMLHNTHEAIVREVQRVMAELHHEAAALALAAAEDEIKRQLTAEDQRRLADEYIAKVAVR